MAEKSFNRIWNSTKAQIMQQKKLFVIMIILLFVGAIFLGLGISSEIKCDYGLIEDYISMDLGYLFYIGSIICGFILTINLFKDLHSKQNADIILSMPLNAKQRFISKLMTMLFVQIIPTVLSIMTACYISYITLPSIGELRLHDGLTEYMTVDLSNGIGIGCLRIFAIILLALLSAILFTNCAASFISCCCGTVVESYLFSILNLICVSSFKFIIISVLFTFAGVQSTVPDSYWGYGAAISGYSLPPAISCLISVFVMFITYFIYKKRNAEDIGKPIVYRWFFNIDMAFGIICVNLIFYCMELFFVGIIFTFIGFIIMQIIISRAKVNFKKVLLWIGGYFGALVILVGFLAAAYFTNGFGYTIEIPKNWNNVDVTLRIDGIERFTTFSLTDGSDINDADDVIISREQANQVTELLFKYRNERKKSFSEFLDMVLFGGYYYDEINYSVYCTFEYGDDYNYDYTLYGYDFRISPESAIELTNDLSDLPFLKKDEEIYGDSEDDETEEDYVDEEL